MGRFTQNINIDQKSVLGVLCKFRNVTKQPNQRLISTKMLLKDTRCWFIFLLISSVIFTYRLYSTSGADGSFTFTIVPRVPTFSDFTKISSHAIPNVPTQSSNCTNTLFHRFYFVNPMFSIGWIFFSWNKFTAFPIGQSFSSLFSGKNLLWTLYGAPLLLHVSLKQAGAQHDSFDIPDKMIWVYCKERLILRAWNLWAEEWNHDTNCWRSRCMLRSEKWRHDLKGTHFSVP